MTKEYIIQGCIDNKRECQRTLYDRYADQLMNICLRYTQDVPQAEDVLQNAFIKIFTKIKEFRMGEGSFEGWMSRITVNEALMLYRKNKRTFYDNTAKELDPEIDAEVLLQLEAEDILKLIQQLPDGFRVVFNLYVIEGYDHKEIGEMLGITASTSRSQLARAKKMLRNLLDPKKTFRYAG
ncbi:MAG: RNA polymerase sigma factor [Bacteroidota bacterium]